MSQLERRGLVRSSPYGSLPVVALILAMVGIQPEVAFSMAYMGLTLEGVATALIGISSIHLLKTFINAAHLEDRVIMWQAAIHALFLISAVMIAITDKIMNQTLALQHQKH